VTTDTRTAQSALHRYDERVELVDLVDDAEPGVCPDCGADISGPLAAVPVPDTVDGECTRGWFCEDCRVSVAVESSRHERMVGGWDGWRIVETRFRDGSLRHIAIPEAADD
jgi:uncharacterized protein with PIN domain